MARRRGNVDQGFARFMRAALSARASPSAATGVPPAFVAEWQAFTGLVTAALAKMPENERTAFAAAIVARAHEWTKAPAGATPRVWPIAIRVERSPID